MAIEHLLLRIPALLVAIVFHEYAHAKTADLLGDPTPRAMGRLSLNPAVHLDPIGTIMLFLVGLGWAKPVQVNPSYFSDPRRGMMLVALAGPLTNVILAYLVLIIGQAVTWTGIWNQILHWTYLINLWLAVFNLFPVPPLDGSRILAGLIPRSDWIYYLEQYGWLILIVLVFTNTIWTLMGPVVSGLDATLRALAAAFTW